jgi:hypothetical protein
MVADVFVVVVGGRGLEAEAGSVGMQTFANGL